MSSSDSRINGPIPTVATVAGAKNPSNTTQPLLVDAQGNLLIAGSITANNPSVGPNGSSIPVDSTLIGGKNGSGNLTPVSVDSSGNMNVNVVSGGPATPQQVDIRDIGGAVPSATNPLPSRLTDGAAFYKPTTPSDTQPISAASLPLPSGASTSALQTSGNSSLTTIAANTTNAGTPVVSGTVTANQGTGGASAWKVDGSAVTQPISAASLPLPTGATTAANQTAVQGTVAAGTAATKSELIGGVFNTSLPTLTNTQQVAFQLDSSGRLIVGTSSAVIGAVTQSGTWTVQPGNTANTTAWLVKELTSSTSTVTSVAGNASSVSLLASNASRLGATFYNDSTAILYLKLGSTASTSSYTLQMAAGSYYELPTPHLYTGAIDGIWASANGNVRITELS